MVAGGWRYILHADLDAFYASVEQRDNPALEGRPVVVGGAPETRGVVAAASYEARRYGIRSAMPMRSALRLCPDLVRVPPRFDRYRELSRQVMDIFRALTPLIEPLSLDEAYLDISEQVPAPEVQGAARKLKAEVRRATGLVVTIGGGVSKTVAKVASQVAKPDGLLLVKQGEECAFLAPLKIDMLWGVGPKTAAALEERGVRTIGQLAACDDAWLSQAFGRRGPELKERALGRDRDPVRPHRETKSVSAEVTMPTDVESERILVEHIDDLASRVAGQLRSKRLKGRTVRIKLRLADFTTFTRQATLPTPTDDEEAIRSAARGLLRRELRPGRRFRLLGVGVAGFSDIYQMALWAQQ